jgi:toxin ParE1/3/4
MSRRNYSLALASEAEDDLEDIFSYTLQTWGEQQLADYAGVIERALEAIASNPFLGHSRADLTPGYRCFIAGRHLIIYRIEEETIYVLRVLHERMDIRRHLSETPDL